ncbi:uncharacterized protein LOC107854114 [Capsicum annuum]|uniref:uncharacterized protein LOC107854114 n=1 Tax=Capsicum annuum TaxID=4072 RepID=UPI001FB0914B|nr:uncharacterized protein LOC107854114 [Capsicum annuum]
MFQQAECAQEYNTEAAHTIDNVVANIPSALPALSPHSPILSFEHNISPIVPAFHLTTPEYALMYDLSFVDMHHPTQLVPFETNFSCPMELIPDMPQQWEATDEGEGLGIFTDQTIQMEPNYSDALATAMLLMPDTSKAGSDVKKEMESFET